MLLSSDVTQNMTDIHQEIKQAWYAESALQKYSSVCRLKKLSRTYQDLLINIYSWDDMEGFELLIILWIRNPHWTQVHCLTNVLSEYSQLYASTFERYMSATWCPVKPWLYISHHPKGRLRLLPVQQGAQKDMSKIRYVFSLSLCDIWWYLKNQIKSHTYQESQMRKHTNVCDKDFK